MGVDPYPPEGKRQSHLINIIQNHLPPHQAISRIGNGVNAMCYFIFMLWCFPNCVRRENPSPQVHALKAEEKVEGSDDDEDKFEGSNCEGFEDVSIQPAPRSEGPDPQTPQGCPKRQVVLTSDAAAEPLEKQLEDVMDHLLDSDNFR